MSVRHSKYLSILLFKQASEHKEKNVPIPKEKKNRNKEEREKNVQTLSGLSFKINSLSNL